MKADKILLIDTDPGIDDALALALAFRHPNVQVPLVTTVAGNTGLESVTTNAQLLLPLFGADASTVLAKGAAKPLKRNIETAEDFHGPDGLGGVRDSVAKQIDKPSVVKANGIKRIVEAAKLYGKDLTIVALGPLTNIARALAQNEKAMRSIGSLVIMGGAVRVPGNTTPAAEFNFFADPHAAEIVLKAGLPTTLVPLDVTEKVRMNSAALRDALKGRRDPAAKALREMTRFSLKRHGREGIALHDPLAVAVALAPELVSIETLPINVITQGPLTAGMTLEDARPFATQNSVGAMVDVAVDVSVADAVEYFSKYTLRSSQDADRSESVKRDGVVVVGGANIDFVVKAKALPRAGETITGEDLLQTEGGKGANQAVAAARAGANVKFVGTVGDDDLGARARASLKVDGIDVEGLSSVKRATGVALIAVDQHGQNQISVAPGANNALSARCVEVNSSVIESAKVMVTQLESPLEAVVRALEVAKSAGLTTVLNPAPVCLLPKVVPGLVDILVANEVEAEALVGSPVRTIPEVRKALDALETIGYVCPIITLGRRGVMYRENGRIGRVKALPVTAVDATAAGDTFVGYLSASLARGESLKAAIELANRASAITVTQMGAQASIPKRGDVIKRKTV